LRINLKICKFARFSGGKIGKFARFSMTEAMIAPPKGVVQSFFWWYKYPSSPIETGRPSAMGIKKPPYHHDTGEGVNIINQKFYSMVKFQQCKGTTNISHMQAFWQTFKISPTRPKKNANLM